MSRLARRMVSAMALVAATASGLTAMQAATVEAGAEVVTTPPPGWSLQSAYSYETQIPSVLSQRVGERMVRVTLGVPAGIETVAAAGNHVAVRNGHATFDMPYQYNVPRMSEYVELPNGDTWHLEFSPVAAQETELKVTKVSPLFGKNGRAVTIRGTLHAGGAPVANHWVYLSDRRFAACEDAGCRVRLHPLGSAQTDADGTWQATISANWSTRIVATYCEAPEFCWLNPRTPGYAVGPLVHASWDAKLTGPATVRAGRPAAFSISVPSTMPANPDVTARVQEVRKGTWVTLARAALKRTSETTYTASVKLAFRTAGDRHRVRVIVPKVTARWPGDPLEFDYTIEAGVSAVKAIRVRR